MHRPPVNIIGGFPGAKELSILLPEASVWRMDDDVSHVISQLSCLGTTSDPVLLVSVTTQRSDVERLLDNEPGAKIFVLCDESKVVRVTASMVGLGNVQVLSKSLPLEELAEIVKQSYIPIPA